MNENQTKKDLWDIADAIEEANIQLENINNLAQLLDEGLERDVCGLARINEESVKWFISRFDMNRALLLAILMMFKTANKQLSELAAMIRTQHKPEETE